MNSYYNTNKLEGLSLAQALNKAGSQEIKILLFFKKHPYQNFAPHDVSTFLNHYLKSAPITSIRRAITNLQKSGHLVKTDKMARGPYGKPVHTWRLAQQEKPAQKPLF